MFALLGRIGAIMAAALLIGGLAYGIASGGAAMGLSLGGRGERPAFAQTSGGAQNATGPQRGGDHEMSQGLSLGRISEVGKNLALVTLAAGAVLMAGKLVRRTSPPRNEEH